MRSFLTALAFVVTTVISGQPFQYDNVKFKTVFPEDLCRTLKENAGYVLLDVRSKGEYADTSSRGLNIGRFKNARHISVGELASRWRELEDVKDKPIFIYCSHSQRSRRASKMLADSGFTNVFNINGGMTNLLTLRHQLGDCFEQHYTTNLSYKQLSAAEIMDRTQKKNPYYIIDLRADSAFRGISPSEKRNTMGKFTEAVNIPFTQLGERLSTIPPNKNILLVDEFGDESAKAAVLLTGSGYKDVTILFNGLDGWMSEVITNGNRSSLAWQQKSAYKIISADEFNNLAKENDVFLLDIRNSDQYTNTSKNYWENIGHIRNAVNIPYPDLETKLSQLPSKDKPVIIYTFSGQPELYECAKKLAGMGFSHVHVLYGGIWNLRWTAHNIKNKAGLGSWIIDIPADNR